MNPVVISVHSLAPKMVTLCESIVRALPGWFVTDEAMRLHLLEHTDRLPMLVAGVDGEAAGFATPIPTGIMPTRVLSTWHKISDPWRSSLCYGARMPRICIW
jgi:hypothetical protein